MRQYRHAEAPSRGRPPLFHPQPAPLFALPPGRRRRQLIGRRPPRGLTPPPAPPGHVRRRPRPRPRPRPARRRARPDGSGSSRYRNVDGRRRRAVAASGAGVPIIARSASRRLRAGVRRRADWLAFSEPWVRTPPRPPRPPLVGSVCWCCDRIDVHQPRRRPVVSGLQTELGEAK